jgi:hypothetical protein
MTLFLLTFKETSFNIVTSSFEGYEKVTLSIDISPDVYVGIMLPLLLSILGS